MSFLQEAVGSWPVSKLEAEHVPQPAVQVSESRHRLAPREGLHKEASAGEL